MKAKKIALFCICIGFALSSVLFAAGQSEGASDTAKPAHYKFATIQNTESPSGKGAQLFADLVKEKTNGRVILDVYPAGQLGNEKDIVDGLEMGTIQFNIAGTAEWAKRDDVVSVFEAPFLFRDRQHLMNFYDSALGQDLLEDFSEKVGVRSLGFMYYGTRHVTTGKAPVKSPADMKGLKLRCPDNPLYLNTVKAMGANPTPMAFAEVYLALQQGVVDGQENPPATIETMKFYEVQEYLIETGHIVAGLMIWTNEEFFSGLEPDLQEAIKSAAQEACDWTNEYAFRMEDEALEKLGTEYGMTRIVPDRAAFMANAQSLLADFEKQWGVPGLIDQVLAIK